MKTNTPRKNQINQPASNNTPIKNRSIGQVNNNYAKNQNNQSNSKNQNNQSNSKNQNIHSNSKNHNIQSNSKNQNIQSFGKKPIDQFKMADLNESVISNKSSNSNKSNKNLDTTINLFNSPADRIVINFWSNYLEFFKLFIGFILGILIISFPPTIGVGIV